DLLHPHALQQQVGRLIHVRRQDAVHPEPRAVLHHDHRLPDATPERHDGAHGGGVGARAGNDLEQRHPRHGGEEMHPDHLPRPRRRTVPGGGGLGMPKSFFICVVAKKICTSLRDTSVTASWPNNCASRFSPSAMPCRKPYWTASSAASGAG